MNITYDFTLNDAIAFNEYHMNTSPAGRRARLKHMLFPPIMWMIIAGIYDVAVRAEDGQYLFPLLAILSITWILVAPVLLKRTMKRKVIQFFKEQENENLLCRHKLFINPNEVIDESKEDRAKTKWKEVEKIGATEDHLFIYVSPVLAYVVPASAFPDREAFIRFRETAYEYHAEAHFEGEDIP